MLVELNRCPAEDDEVNIRAERDLQFGKLKDVEQLVESWDRRRPAKDLTEAIRRILSPAAIRNE